MRNAREVSVTRWACSIERWRILRMAVPLIDRRVCREEVEVALALDVPHPRSLASGDDDVERVVVVRADLLGRGDQVLALSS